MWSKILDILTQILLIVVLIVAVCLLIGITVIFFTMLANGGFDILCNLDYLSDNIT